MSSLPPSSIPLPEKGGGGMLLIGNLALAAVLTGLAFLVTVAAWAGLTILTNTNIWYAAGGGGLIIAAAMGFAFRNHSRLWGLITLLPAIGLALLAILLADILYYSYVRVDGQLDQIPTVLERTALSIFNILGRNENDVISYVAAAIGALIGSFARRS